LNWLSCGISHLIAFIINISKLGVILIYLFLNKWVKHQHIKARRSCARQQLWDQKRKTKWRNHENLYIKFCNWNKERVEAFPSEETFSTTAGSGTHRRRDPKFILLNSDKNDFILLPHASFPSTSRRWSIEFIRPPS